MGESQDARIRANGAAARLADLADAWTTDAAGQEQPDWTRLRAFLDYLARHPEVAAAAIEAPPPASGSLFIDNLLAGIAEVIADVAGVLRPVWAGEVPPLDQPWEGLGTPRMRAANAAAAPPQLVARQVLIPTESLWRPGVRSRRSTRD